ncbi:MAG: hypothetical protein IJW55_02650 [Clostridia bacterium]|nr:hypothetical protein [Clostridia bacterium]
MKTLKKLSFLLAMLMALTCIVPFTAVATEGDEASVVTATPDNTGYSADAVEEVNLDDIPDITTLRQAPTGSGTYKITTAAGLITFSELVNRGTQIWTVTSSNVGKGLPFQGCTVYLANDIDMSAQSMNPIGNHNTALSSHAPTCVFAGTFDGQGHTIKNLTMSMSDSTNVALFGGVRGAVIKNLRIESSTFKYTGSNASATTAALVGTVFNHGQDVDNKQSVSVTVGSTTTNYDTNIFIQNVYTNATVTANKGYAGGIVGAFVAGTGYVTLIENCTNDGAITSSGTYASGIAGSGSKATNYKGRGVIVKSCLNTGAVSANEKVGGIAVDFAYGDFQTYIMDCVNTGDISGGSSATHVAGIFAVLRYAKQYIVNCVNYGTISCESTTGVKDGIYNTVNTGSADHVVDCERKTTEDIPEEGFECGYSASYVAEADMSSATDIDEYFANEPKQYKITTADGLIEFASLVNSRLCVYTSPFKGYTVYLADDIDMSGKTMSPIGSSSNISANSSGNVFYGTFDGQGHAIKNLTMTSTSETIVALFGTVRSATIKNLVIDSSCSFTSAGVAAAVVGKVIYIGGATTTKLEDIGPGASIVIENVYSAATVSATSETGTAGAIVGTVVNNATDYLSVIRNCTNAGTVTSQNSAGGIIGEGLAEDSNGGRGFIVVGCLNSGSVTATVQAGGIAVAVHPVSHRTPYVSIENSVNVGNVEATDETAGIAAGIMVTLPSHNTTKTSGGKVILSHCVNYGTISATTKGAIYAEEGDITPTKTACPDHTVSLTGHGIQLEEVDEQTATTQDIRFVYGITEDGFKNYSAVGMKIVVKDIDGNSVKEFNKTCEYVYESLTGVAGGETAVYTTDATDTSAICLQDGGYLFAVVIDGVPAGETYTFEVTPYCVVDGNTVYGATSSVDWEMGTNPSTDTAA